MSGVSLLLGLGKYLSYIASFSDFLNAETRSSKIEFWNSRSFTCFSRSVSLVLMVFIVILANSRSIPSDVAIPVLSLLFPLPFRF